MKHYPSILGVNKNPIGFGEQCIAFEKIDGSNLRWEWNSKKGWTSKYGTRTHLFDKKDEVFGCSVDLFFNKMASKLENQFKNDRLFRDSNKITVYAEFFGECSPEDPKELYLLDIWVDRKGFIGPKNLLKLFTTHLIIPKVIYCGEFTKSFEQDVRMNIIYPLNEGVVVKGGEFDKHWMVKIKTNDYMNRLKAFGYDLKEYGE
jgi:hypothetical protein